LFFSLVVVGEGNPVHNYYLRVVGFVVFLVLGLFWVAWWLWLNPQAVLRSQKSNPSSEIFFAHFNLGSGKVKQETLKMRKAASGIFA